jgi:hypothetical protein
MNEQRGRAKDQRHVIVSGPADYETSILRARERMRAAHGTASDEDRISAPTPDTIAKISRHDSLDDVVEKLKPFAERAKRSGNERAFYIWRVLDAENSPSKPVGDLMVTIRLFLDALDQKSQDEILAPAIRAKAADAMALLQSGKGSQNVAQRLQSIEVLRGLLNPKN